MTKTEPVNEVRYLMAHNFLAYLLEQGKISLKEFQIADEFVVESTSRGSGLFSGFCDSYVRIYVVVYVLIP